MSDGSSVTSAPVTVTINANLPPDSVTITAPANNSSWVEGVPVTVTVTAHDADGTVTNVTVLVNDVAIGSDSAAPYSVVFSNSTVIPYAFTAVATDDSGASSTSAPVNITITANQPPSITSFYVEEGAAQVSATTIASLTAATNRMVVTDPVGVVNRVVYYLDGRSIFTNLINAANATNCYLMSDALAGVHQVYGVAIDNSGASVTSSIVTVTVTNDSRYTMLVANGSTWQYLDNNTDPGATWTQLGFDASRWSNGLADLGYGNSRGGATSLAQANDTDFCHPERTVVEGGPTANRYATTFFRHVFQVASPALYTNLAIRLLRDDGAAVYLNGNLVWTNNLPGVFSNPTRALAVAGDDGFEVQENLSINPSNLVAGSNVIAVEIHQSSATSSDIDFDLQLLAQTGAPPLAIEVVGSALEISWPESTVTYVLEETLSLNPRSWGAANVVSIQIRGGRVRATVNPSGTMRLFRLRN